MRRPLLLLTLGLALLTGGEAKAWDLCFGNITVLCVRELGYDFQRCGQLLGEDGAPAVFENCADLDTGDCYPCALQSSRDTANACTAVYGPKCNRFKVEDPKFETYR
jgi:hypothetical protein